MAAKQLTKEELAWLHALQAHLDKCPSTRIGAFTTGDRSLFVYDKVARNKWAERNGGSFKVEDRYAEVEIIEKAEAHRFTLRFPFQVDGLVG